MNFLKNGLLLIYKYFLWIIYCILYFKLLYIVLVFVFLHDIIIIDSQPHTDTEAKSAIRESDLVIIPVQPSPADLWASGATISLAEKENKDIAILLNRMSSNSKLAREIMEDVPYLLDNTLGNRVAFASCLMEGKTVTETDPSSLAASEIKSLIKELSKKFNLTSKLKELALQD